MDRWRNIGNPSKGCLSRLCSVKWKKRWIFAPSCSMPRIRGLRSHSLPKANGFSIAMWKAESHYNECPSGAIAQLTFLCQRSDSLVSYDIVFSKKRKFMRFSKSWHDSSPMSSAIRDGSERSLPFLRCVPGMAQVLRVKVPSRVFTAKCSEPQAENSNV